MSALDDLHPDLAALLGTVIHDRYRVDSLLGRGGMGAVFKAHHLGLGRDMALKVLRPGLTSDESMSKRFVREARSVSRLDHPNCVRVSDFSGEDGELMYIVMELLEGHELEEQLGQPWAPLRAIDTASQILEALEHAHHFGIVHRDLKPENVFLTKDFRGREVVKLVDFGIAKLLEDDGGEQLTRQGMVFGTPRYMSPEQASGGKLDERTDLYATGLLLYEMLAGKPPFDASEVTVLLRMQILAPPPELPAEVPDVLRAVVTKLLEKSRKDRYSSAREVIAALEQAREEIAGPSASTSAGGPSSISATGPTARASASLPSASLPTAPTGAATVPDAAGAGADASASSSVPSGWYAAESGLDPAASPSPTAPTVPPLGPAGSAAELSGPSLSGPSLSGPSLSGPSLSGPLGANAPTLPPAASGPSYAPTQSLELQAVASPSSARPRWMLWALLFGICMITLMAFGAGLAMRDGDLAPIAPSELDPAEPDPRFDADCDDEICGCEGKEGVEIHECALECGEGCALRCAGAARCELEVGAGSRVHCERFGRCEVSCLGDCEVSCPGGKCQVSCPELPSEEPDDGKPKRKKKKPKRPKANECGKDLFVCGECP